MYIYIYMYEYYRAPQAEAALRPAACPHARPPRWPRRSAHPAARPCLRAPPGGSPAVLGRCGEVEGPLMEFIGT